MNTGEILIYQNQEGTIKIDVRLEEETVWLTPASGSVSLVPIPKNRRSSISHNSVFKKTIINLFYPNALKNGFFLCFKRMGCRYIFQKTDNPFDDFKNKK